MEPSTARTLISVSPKKGKMAVISTLPLWILLFKDRHIRAGRDEHEVSRNTANTEHTRRPSIGVCLFCGRKGVNYKRAINRLDWLKNEGMSRDIKQERLGLTGVYGEVDGEECYDG